MQDCDPKRTSIFPICLVVMFASLATGCLQLPGRDGTKHTLVLGFGLVSVKDYPEKRITATRAHIAGLSVSNQAGVAVNAGLMSQFITTVPVDSRDTIVEARAAPWGALHVTTPEGDLDEEVEYDQNKEVESDR